MAYFFSTINLIFLFLIVLAISLVVFYPIYIILFCNLEMYLHRQQDKDYLKMIRRDPVPGMKHWINCEVCKISMKHLNQRARSMRDAMKHEELGEEHFHNITKYHCQPYHDHGEWITTYDVSKKRKKDQLLLVHKDYFGKCGNECETIAESCQELITEYEEELQEYLYSRISTAKLQKKVCKKSCKKNKKKRNRFPFQKEWGSEEHVELADDQKGMFRSFVMGQLHKREQPKSKEDEQQDYLQRYAEAYIDQTETAKQQKAAKRRYDNKMRARKGLPPLPEEDEEENADGETNDVGPSDPVKIDL